MLLTLILCLPLLAALVIAFIPREIRFGIRLIALGTTLVSTSDDKRCESGSQKPVVASGAFRPKGSPGLKFT